MHDGLRAADRGTLPGPAPAWRYLSDRWISTSGHAD
jgi:hypothetical protein